MEKQHFHEDLVDSMASLHDLHLPSLARTIEGPTFAVSVGTKFDLVSIEKGNQGQFIKEMVFSIPFLLNTNNHRKSFSLSANCTLT
jgi:hypothetical protein